jgi:hypothetical protein
MTVRPALELPLACAAAAAVGAAAACTCRPSHTAASASATPTTPLHRQPEPEPSNDDEPARRPDAAFNCSPAPRIASAPLMWVAERPGRDAADSPTEADVDHWVEHMQRRGVERVLCLLGDKHLKLYSHLEVDGTLQQAVERRGLRWAGVPFSRDKPLYLHLIAAARQLRDAERCGGKRSALSFVTFGSFCQDGLGTNIGQAAEKRASLFPQRAWSFTAPQAAGAPLRWWWHGCADAAVKILVQQWRGW